MPTAWNNVKISSMKHEMSHERMGRDQGAFFYIKFYAFNRIMKPKFNIDI